MAGARPDILSKAADGSNERGERGIVNLPGFGNRRHALAQV